MPKISKVPLPEFRGAKSFTNYAPLTRHVWNSGFHEKRPVYPYMLTEVVRNESTWSHDYASRYCQIAVAFDGEIRYRGNGKTYILRENKVMIIPGGLEYRLESTRKAYYHKVSLFLLGVNLAAICETLGFTELEMLTVPDIGQILHDMREIGKMIETGKERDMPEMSGRTLALLSRLSILRTEQDENPMLFQMAKSRLSSNFEHPLTVTALAKELNISQSTLERMFKKHVKMTPREFRIYSRIAQARELLQYNDLSIKEISFKLGYCHQFHFANEFTRLTGVSPARYRKENVHIS